MGQLNAQFGLDNSKADAAIAKTDQAIKQLSGSLNNLDETYSESASASGELAVATDQMSQKMEKNVSWVRAARTEHRQNAFALTEGRNTMMLFTVGLMALSNSQEGASQKEKALNKSLMECVIAFQATDFAVRGLNAAFGFGLGSGTISAIGAIVAVGVGLISFLNNAKMSTKEYNEELQKQYDLDIKLGLISPKAQASNAQEKVNDAQYEVDKLKKQQADLQASIKKLQGTTSSPEESGQNWASVLALQRQLRGVNDELIKAITLSKQAQSDFKALFDAQQAEATNNTLEKKALFDAQQAEATNNALEKMDDYLENIQRSTEAANEEINELDKEALNNQKKKEEIQKSLEQHVKQAQKDQEKADRDQEKSAQKIIKDQEEYLSDLSMGFGELNNGLSAVGMRADSIVSKLIKGTQYALKIMQTLNASGSEGGSAGGVLSIIGNILGIVSLFDSGGYTGSGGRFEPAGIVHKGEVVFEKPIVDRYGMQLMALRSSLQSSPSFSSGGNYSGGGVVSGGNLGTSIAKAMKGFTLQTEVRGNKLSVLMSQSTRVRKGKLM